MIASDGFYKIKTGKTKGLVDQINFYPSHHCEHVKHGCTSFFCLTGSLSAHIARRYFFCSSMLHPP